MNAEARVNAIVVPDACLIYDVIIGRDFLEQEHNITIKHGNKLSFEQLSEIKDTGNIVNANFLDIKRSTINIGNVDDAIRQQCISLIREFDDCVASSIQDLGKTDATAMSISCTSEMPVVYRPFRLAGPEKSALREIVADKRIVLINGIIRESSSPYASPVIPGTEE